MSPVDGNRTHPLLRDRPLAHGAAPEMLARMSDALDELALVVRRLPGYPLAPVHRERLRIIARELLRKANA